MNGRKVLGPQLGEVLADVLVGQVTADEDTVHEAVPVACRLGEVAQRAGSLALLEKLV
jgi:hypothetical protein